MGIQEQVVDQIHELGIITELLGLILMDHQGYQFGNIGVLTNVN